VHNEILSIFNKSALFFSHNATRLFLNGSFSLNNQSGNSYIVSNNGILSQLKFNKNVSISTYKESNKVSLQIDGSRMLDIKGNLYSDSLQLLASLSNFNNEANLSTYISPLKEKIFLFSEKLLLFLTPNFSLFWKMKILLLPTIK
jgi:hypothetical protein